MSDDDNILPFTIPATIDELLKHSGIRFRFFTLVNREPVEVGSLDRWTDEMVRRGTMTANYGVDPWRVDETIIGNARISTVFLGLDHRFRGKGPPILFETMIFGGRLDDFQNRCGTWDEAEAMHAEAVRQVRGGHLRVIK